jgi:hypothetical protein
MIISDMSYQEYTVESADLEGGVDIGASITNYNYDLTQFYTVSQSGPNGSYAAQGALKIDLSSFGGSIVALGL